MKRKRTSAARADHPLRVVLVTLDNHVSGAWSRAAHALSKQVPALSVSAHAATEWDRDPASLEETCAAIADGDIGRSDINSATRLPRTTANINGASVNRELTASRSTDTNAPALD